jgi:TatA/E family protein of Tat protein translocase
MPEIIVILVIALIIFGPSKLPEVARSIGKGMQEFRNMTMGVERTMKDEFEAIIKDGEEPPAPEDDSKKEGVDEVKFPGEEGDGKDSVKTKDPVKPVDDSKPATKDKAEKPVVDDKAEA